MIASQHVYSAFGLDSIGLKDIDTNDRQMHWNLTPAELYEHAIRNGEAVMTRDGALRVKTGQYTGRSPKDKFFVEESSSKDKIWWGTVNQSISEDIFDHMHEKVLGHLSE